MPIFGSSLREMFENTKQTYTESCKSGHQLDNMVNFVTKQTGKSVSKNTSVTTIHARRYHI